MVEEFRIELNIYKDNNNDIDIDGDIETLKYILNEMSSYECVSQAHYHVQLN